ncbi:MAG: DUF1326 domain-containing protein [Planctomycetaceae bacterium]|jgi:hypothetical protein
MRAAILSCVVLTVSMSTVPGADLVTGNYVEVRTCQVYTGPCFANGEVGSVGKNAIMTWRITRGTFAGVDLTGQSVSVIVKASHTLGFKGLDDAASKKAIVVIDSAADVRTASALRSFALVQTKIAEQEVAATQRAPIDLQFNVSQLTATVEIGDIAQLQTRPARKGDCICSNESAYYPPLTRLKGFVPGVTIEGEVTARPLGTRWSVPDSRTAYMGSFEVEADPVQLAERL